MNTNALKRFAQQARRKLLQQVEAKLEYVLKADTVELREQKEQLQALKEEIDKSGKAPLIDKVAYTWFNRLIALRFMDANDYQPSGIRIISPKDGFTLPEILYEAKRGNIPAEFKVDLKKVDDILSGKILSTNPQNEAFKELLIAACNDLHRLFPFLFERINDYTELLLPDDLTSEFSIVADVVEGMPAEDCLQVEIIGWLYQFYISEKKDEVFASKSKVKKEDIPAATQLFTPRWIVEYMVQNTLGKLWLQNKPDSKLREHMPYFIESASLETDDYIKITSPEEIKLLDQACGSGHILVYAFELLTKIYEEEGYNQNEIPTLIIINNLYGFEIDGRAAQLAAMALLMKAREYQRRLFRKDDVAEPVILCFRDLKLSDDETEKAFENATVKPSDELIHDLRNMQQATNLGSLIIPQASPSEISTVQEKINKAYGKSDAFLRYQFDELLAALEQLQMLSQKFHCVVDNPPYMGGGNMNKPLADFVKINYPDSKADLMACFMEAGLAVLKEKGFLGMINQHSWMFLSSYEKLRKKLINDINFDTLLHLGPRTFPEIGGEVVQNAAFTFNKINSLYLGKYIKLVEYKNSERKKQQCLRALREFDSNYYSVNQLNFLKIPGAPVAYWANEKIYHLYEKKKVKDAALPRVGCQTSNNTRFLRYWWEVINSKFSVCGGVKWYPYYKGGGFRKWYGNIELVLNWENNGKEVINLATELYRSPTRTVKNQKYYFKKGITWSTLSSGPLSMRVMPYAGIFDTKGSALFVEKNENYYTLLAFLNSNVAQLFIELTSPTLDYSTTSIGNIPLMETNKQRLNDLVEKTVMYSKKDWDSSEYSFDFAKPIILQFETKEIEEANDLCISYWKNILSQFRQNEEEINKYFINIYGLENELTAEVKLEDVTILQEELSVVNGDVSFNATEIFLQFNSYCLGCFFGRYSLDKEGLILANQGQTLSDYLREIGKTKENVTILPGEDNAIPILEDEWFEDDIVALFYQFLKVTFGEQNFSKNLAFLEEQIGKDIRKYFIKDFYDDHIKRYKKRPIYWMFSSPKGHFNVLIYMHRYTPDTLNIILNDYLRPFQDKLQARKGRLEQVLVSGSATDQSKANKEIAKINDMLQDCQYYEREILYPLATQQIAIDLDDGVLVNYNKFGKAVKEVKGLNDLKTKKKVRGFDWIDTSKIK